MPWGSGELIIISRYPPLWCRRNSKAAGREAAAEITDDTQMILFTAEGLLPQTAQAASACEHQRSGASSYLRWLHTQGKTTPF